MDILTAAGIVLYNPDIRRLKECIDSVIGQIDKIYLVDNASKNRLEIEKLLKRYEACEIIWNDENCGIAKGLNQIMEAATAEGYMWVLTLDDDSVCDKGLVQTLLSYVAKEAFGIVCAAAIDDKMDVVTVSDRDFEIVKDCITAGSLTNVEAWKHIGGFDEWMFIDFVDIEYCVRLREHGYKIGRVNSVYVHQQYGNISSSFHLFGRKWYRFDYSPIRIYYSVRNQIYYMNKHKNSIDRYQSLLFLGGYIAKRILFERNRKASIRAVFRGIKDGIKV